MCDWNWIYIKILVDDDIDLFHLMNIYQIFNRFFYAFWFSKCLYHYYYHQLNSYTFYVYNQHIQWLFHCLLHFELSHIFSITFAKILPSKLLSSVIPWCIFVPLNWYGCQAFSGEVCDRTHMCPHTRKNV